MVRAWIADVTPLYGEKYYKEYYERLPDFRKVKADALRHRKTQAQSVGAWSLWEKIREEYNLQESSVFNLSHSGNLVMCAAHIEDTRGVITRRDPGYEDKGSVPARKRERVRVGCDLEQVRELRLRIAERFFCEEEYLTIRNFGTEEARKSAFYRYWVLKESFMKATRMGMALPLDSFSIRLGKPSALTRQPEHFQECYYYREYTIDGAPYKMAVCSTDDNIDSRIHTELIL